MIVSVYPKTRYNHHHFWAISRRNIMSNDQIYTTHQKSHGKTWSWLVLFLFLFGALELHARPRDICFLLAGIGRSHPHL